MAKISLREYNSKIEHLIETGHSREAIKQSQYILRHFPLCLENYRLLGKAYLESKRYNEAVDIFQRMLMSVPDDFVSHVGLSIIADDQSRLDEAIWHMERAFETQPSNAAIQGELQRLFGRRDGVEPPKIRLTRGALAHMYVQGELYTQAVSEIRAVLANDPHRLDMKVLLAKAYYYMGMKAETNEHCSQILKSYPYCLDANRILVEILCDAPHNESTQLYRQRVSELDPYSTFTSGSIFKSYEVIDSAIMIEYGTEQKERRPDELAKGKYAESAFRVFLCHSSQDKPKVRDIYRFLTKTKNTDQLLSNLDLWLDEEKLIPGDDWDLEIRKAVRSSDIILVCLSKTSTNKEGYFQKEIREALDVAQEKPDGTIFIIPLRLEDCQVPDRLQRYEWLNYFDADAKKKLLLSIQKRANQKINDLV